MNNPTRRLLIALSAAALALGMAWAISILGSPHRMAASPSSPSANAGAPQLLPGVPLLLPNDVGYVNQSPGSQVTAPTGRALAQLRLIPPSLTQAELTNFPRQSTFGPMEVGYQILSSVRYEGIGSTVYVTLAQPTPAATQRGFGLGNESFQLPDGSTAWVIAGMPTPQPNQVRWLKNGLIITVAGNVSVDQLKSLAADVVLSQ